MRDPLGLVPYGARHQGLLIVMIKREAIKKRLWFNNQRADSDLLAIWSYLSNQTISN